MTTPAPWRSWAISGPASVDRQRSCRRCSPEPAPSASLTVGSGAAGASSPTITLYSGQHQQTTQSLITAFEKKTGINVAVRYDDEDTFTNEILAEKSHPVADVFYTENSPPLEYLQEKGVLATLTASTLAKTPSSTTRPTATGSGSPPG